MKNGTWIERLNGLLGEVPKDYKTHDAIKVKYGETVIGKLTPNLITFVRMMDWCSENILSELETHAKSCKANDACETFHRKMADDMEELGALKSVFYASLRYELGISVYDHPSIGIRDGEVVVSNPPPPKPKIEMVGIEIPPDFMDALRLAAVGTSRDRGPLS